MKKIYSILAMILVFACSYGQKAVKIPYNWNSVMIDGKFEPEEWKNAARIKVNDSLEFFIQQDAKNLYWCLHGLYHHPKLMVVDFYITHHHTLLDLHASAKLGERKMSNGNYGTWQWWNNKGWTATIGRLDNIEQKKFLPNEAKEFQFRKSRFNDKSFRLMFLMEYPADMSVVFPSKTDTLKIAGWKKFSL